MSNITLVTANAAATPGVAPSYFGDGELLVDWRQEQEKLEPGAAVAVIVTIQFDDLNQPYLLSADANCGADAFEIPGIDSEGQQWLRQKVGATMPAIVTVRERVGQHSCHGSRYTIEPQITFAPLPINPTVQQRRDLTPKSQVIVEGAFAGYFAYTTPRSYGQDTAQVGFYLDTPNGRIEVRTFFTEGSQNASYRDGVLENLNKKLMIEGETVRYTAFATGEDWLNGAYNYAYMLVPDPQRHKVYNRLRRTVKILLRSLESYVVRQQFSKARALFAELRHHELTKDEHRSACGLVATLPVNEQPVYGHVDDAKAFERAFGVNVERLNKEQFLRFAHEVLLGIRKSPAGKKRRVELYRLFDYTCEAPFTAEENSKFLAMAVWARLEMLKQDPSDKKYVLEQALACMGYCDHQSALDELMKFIDVCYAEGYFPDQRRKDGEEGDNKRTAPACPPRFDSMMGRAFEAIGMMQHNELQVANGIDKAKLGTILSLMEAQGAERWFVNNARRRSLIG